MDNCWRKTSQLHVNQRNRVEEALFQSLDLAKVMNSIPNESMAYTSKGPVVFCCTPGEGSWILLYYPSYYPLDLARTSAAFCGRHLTLTLWLPKSAAVSAVSYVFPIAGVPLPGSLTVLPMLEVCFKLLEMKQDRPRSAPIHHQPTALTNSRSNNHNGKHHQQPTYRCGFWMVLTGAPHLPPSCSLVLFMGMLPSQLDPPSLCPLHQRTDIVPLLVRQGTVIPKVNHKLV